MENIRNIVTSLWLKEQIKSCGIQQKQLAKDLLTSEQCVSRWLSGKQNLSGANKAALYYYFEYLKLSKKSTIELLDNQKDKE